MRKGSRKQKRHAGAVCERLGIKHARARFGERYSRHLSEGEYWAAVEAIRGGQARRLYEQGRRIHWYLVCVGETRAIAVFDRNRDRINTFLALAALSDIGLRLEDVA